MRKEAILKITVGDKVPKEWQWHVDSLKRITPVAGTEDQYNRFVTAVAERTKQQARFDQACHLHDQHLSDDSRALMKHEGQQLDRRLLIEMQYLDAWRSTCKHIDDLVAVPEEDVRNVISISMSDKIDGLDFTLKRGLLASKVAQAIRRDVTEFDFDPPMCKEHGA